ncbi:uncharacterized protein ColSpa_06674 [Colletotrichum spaethianum]|uniref:NAD-specific glutamate dehydrogenase n=1 Tax=Colletotrichum spaethianum TaxID=700344 RepID=A0AA37NYR5_9PEZI|nr:uncharacterized protein ColSpa_06674 [Colletotrichum spaethianum]GKT46492.1 hypothetical protein ColSpa_06674 [Colletotrichum spaethianum]
MTEVLVDELGLVVTLILLACLFLKAQSLVEGVVQLGVGVDNLLLAHEGLESLAQTGDLTVVLGEGAHDLRVAEDEGGVDTLLLDVLADELVDHAGVGEGRRALELHLLEDLLEELVGLGSVQLVGGGELLAGGLLELGNHLEALPGLLPVDLVHLTVLGVELGLVAAGDVLDEAADQLLSQVHNVVDIGEGLVELAGGELGVVGEVDALVSELTTKLVDAVEATNDKLLEVELGSYSHEHGHVQIVVVGDEGSGGSTTGNGTHHGRLNLDEVSLVEESSDVGDHLGSGDEDLTALVVHDEVQVALAVTLLVVLEAVVLVGQGVQAGGQEDELGREDGQFTLLALLDLGLGCRAAGVSDDTNNVTAAEVDVLVLEGRAALADLLRLGHDLDLDALGTDVVEEELVARGTLVVDTSAHADDLLLVMLARLEVAEVLDKVAQVVVGYVSRSVYRFVQGSRCADLTVELVGVLLVGFGIALLSVAGGLGRGGSGLLGLLSLPLAGLLALLQLRLGDHLAGDIVLEQLGGLFDLEVLDLLGGGLGSAGVGHDCGFAVSRGTCQ